MDSSFIFSQILRLLLSTVVSVVILRIVFKKSIIFKIGIVLIVLVMLAGTVSRLSGMGLVNSVVSTLVIVGAGFATIFFVNSFFKKPLNNFRDKVDELSKGDLSIDFTQKESKNELDDLNNSLSLLIGNLRNVITKINRDSENLINTSSQINITSLQLSEGAVEQAASVEEVSSTMEQMQANISNNTENAKSTEQMSLSVQTGTMDVAEKAQTSTIAQNGINEKVAVINDIASQTNILA